MKKENKDDKKNLNQKNVKKIKNILSDTKPSIKEFDVLFIVDATGSMSSYIISAKEETNNISDELRKTYPDKNFKYGYIFYRDPIDSKEDIHEIIDLTDDVNSIPEKIAKIEAKGGGDQPEDWAGAYKLANEKISWRNGTKAIIHLTDAGAHGKLFTLDDNYPEEEEKLIKELEICAENGIKIFGYVIEEDCRRSFNEASKIYKNKGGSFEIVTFHSPDMMYGSDMNPMMNMGMNPMMNMGMNPMMNMGMNPMMNTGMNPMMNMGMNSMMNNMGMNPMMNNMSMNMGMNQMMNNNCFRNQTLNSIKSII